MGIKAPSFPSERKRVKTPRTGLLTCALSSHLPRNESLHSAPVVSRGCSAMGGTTRAEILLIRCPHKTGDRRVALTVAGQWRNFTAFPSILCELVIINRLIFSSGRHRSNSTSLVPGSGEAWWRVKWYPLFGIVKRRRAGSGSR